MRTAELSQDSLSAEPCGMPLAIPAIFGALVGLALDWLLWRWFTRAFRPSPPSRRRGHVSGHSLPPGR